MEWFSGKETGIAVYEEWRKAFEHIATCVRGPLRELGVFMAGADNTDKQFYNTYGITLQAVDSVTSAVRLLLRRSDV